MFKLVGTEHFNIGKTKCCITIDAVAGFAYEYGLDVNGKPLQKFREAQNKVLKCWIAATDGVQRRIVLGRIHIIVYFISRRPIMIDDKLSLSAEKREMLEIGHSLIFSAWHIISSLAT